MMKINLISPMKHSQTYLENGPAPPLDLHYLRISAHFTLALV